MSDVFQGIGNAVSNFFGGSGDGLTTKVDIKNVNETINRALISVKNEKTTEFNQKLSQYNKVTVNFKTTGGTIGPGCTITAVAHNKADLFTKLEFKEQIAGKVALDFQNAMQQAAAGSVDQKQSGLFTGLFSKDQSVEGNQENFLKTVNDVKAALTNTISNGVSIENDQNNELTLNVELYETDCIGGKFDVTARNDFQGATDFVTDTIINNNLSNKNSTIARQSQSLKVSQTMKGISLEDLFSALLAPFLIFIIGWAIGLSLFALVCLIMSKTIVGGIMAFFIRHFFPILFGVGFVTGVVLMSIPNITDMPLQDRPVLYILGAILIFFCGMFLTLFSAKTKFLSDDAKKQVKDLDGAQAQFLKGQTKQVESQASSLAKNPVEALKGLFQNKAGGDTKGKGTMFSGVVDSKTKGALQKEINGAKTSILKNESSYVTGTRLTIPQVILSMVLFLLVVLNMVIGLCFVDPGPDGYPFIVTQKMNPTSSFSYRFKFKKTLEKNKIYRIFPVDENDEEIYCVCSLPEGHEVVGINIHNDHQKYFIRCNRETNATGTDDDNTYIPKKFERKRASYDVDFMEEETTSKACRTSVKYKGKPIAYASGNIEDQIDFFLGGTDVNQMPPKEEDLYRTETVDEEETQVLRKEAFAMNYRNYEFGEFPAAFVPFVNWHHSPFRPLTRKLGYVKSKVDLITFYTDRFSSPHLIKMLEIAYDTIETKGIPVETAKKGIMKYLQKTFGTVDSIGGFGAPGHPLYDLNQEIRSSINTIQADLENLPELASSSLRPKRFGFIVGAIVGACVASAASAPAAMDNTALFKAMTKKTQTIIAEHVIAHYDIFWLFKDREVESFNSFHIIDGLIPHATTKFCYGTKEEICAGESEEEKYKAAKDAGETTAPEIDSTSNPLKEDKVEYKEYESTRMYAVGRRLGYSSAFPFNNCSQFQYPDRRGLLSENLVMPGKANVDMAQELCRGFGVIGAYIRKFAPMIEVCTGDSTGELEGEFIVEYEIKVPEVVVQR